MVRTGVFLTLLALASPARHFEVAASFEPARKAGANAAVAVTFRALDPDVHVNETPAPQLRLDLAQRCWKIASRRCRPPFRPSTRPAKPRPGAGALPVAVSKAAPPARTRRRASSSSLLVARGLDRRGSADRHPCQRAVSREPPWQRRSPPCSRAPRSRPKTRSRRAVLPAASVDGTAHCHGGARAGEDRRHARERRDPPARGAVCHGRPWVGDALRLVVGFALPPHGQRTANPRRRRVARAGSERREPRSCWPTGFRSTTPSAAKSTGRARRASMSEARGAAWRGG